MHQEAHKTPLGQFSKAYSFLPLFCLPYCHLRQGLLHVHAPLLFTDILLSLVTTVNSVWYHINRYKTLWNSSIYFWEAPWFSHIGTYLRSQVGNPNCPCFKWLSHLRLVVRPMGIIINSEFFFNFNALIIGINISNQHHPNMNAAVFVEQKNVTNKNYNNRFHRLTCWSITSMHYGEVAMGRWN